MKNLLAIGKLLLVSLVLASPPTAAAALQTFYFDYQVEEIVISNWTAHRFKQPVQVLDIPSGATARVITFIDDDSNYYVKMRLFRENRLFELCNTGMNSEQKQSIAISGPAKLSFEVNGGGGWDYAEFTTCMLTLDIEIDQAVLKNQLTVQWAADPAGPWIDVGVAPGLHDNPTSFFRLKILRDQVD